MAGEMKTTIGGNTLKMHLTFIVIEIRSVSQLQLCKGALRQRVIIY